MSRSEQGPITRSKGIRRAGRERGDRRLHLAHRTGIGAPVAGDREEMPLVGHTLQRVSPAVDELDARPEHQLTNGARHQDLTGTGCGNDTGGNIHRDPREIVAASVALAGVDAGPNLDAQLDERRRRWRART